MPFALYDITNRRAIVSANANNANMSSQNTTVKYCSHICMISNSVSLCHESLFNGFKNALVELETLIPSKQIQTQQNKQQE